VDDLLDSAFILLQDVCDSFRNLLILDDDVLNTNREAVVDQPIVDYFLHTTHVVSTGLWSKIFDDHVIEALPCCTND